MKTQHSILFLLLLIMFNLSNNSVLYSQWQQSEFIIGTFRNPYLTGIHDQDTLAFGLAKRAYFNLLSAYCYGNNNHIDWWGPRPNTNANLSFLIGQTYAMNLAAEYGLKYFSNDYRHCEILTHSWWIDGSATDGIYSSAIAANVIADYKTNLPTSPRNLRNTLYGYHIIDEPAYGANDLNNALSWIGYLKTNDPGKVAFVNLLPYYAISIYSGRTGINTEQDYIQYLNNYLVNPSANTRPELAVIDNYLNSWLPGSTSTPVRYFYNFDLFRQKAGPNSSRSAIPFWGYVDVNENGGRQVDSAYMKFSAYSHLAYGAKGIMYFVYDHPDLANIGLVWNTNLTYKYWCARKINNYIKNVIGPAIMSSHCIGTYHKDDFKDLNGATLEIIPSTSRITNSPFVTNLSDNRAMVGEFYDDINKVIYLLVVNKGYRNTFPTINVTVELPGDLSNKIYTTSTTGNPNWNYISVSSTFSNNFTYFTVSNLLPGEGRLYKVIDCGLGMWDWQSSNAIYGDATNIPVPADYDGDGKTDLAVKNSSGQWKIDYASNGFGSWDVTYYGYGDANSIPVPADYDGDNKADLSIKNSLGEWKIDYASDGFGSFNITYNNYGGADAHPVPADYDGDGKADLSVKADWGSWYIDYASNGFGSWDNTYYNYGGSDAHPVPADYDGDGKADLSVKADWGSWYINYAANGFANGWDLTVTGYGDASNIPVPADYDGDLKADLSIKNNSGEWKIDFASNSFTGWDDFNFQYGSSDTHPITGDYNGDGKADFSVKTDGGNWYIDYSGFKEKYLNKFSQGNNNGVGEKIIDDYVTINNYPNPFNPTTMVSYQISKPGFVTIKVFDVLGKELQTLVKDYKKEGHYTVTFDGTNLSSGTYFYQITVGNKLKSGKMLLMK